MSVVLPVISTRFPAVNHDLHVNVKRVNLEKEYGEGCKYFNDFITHKISDKKPTTRYLFSLRVLSIIGNNFVWNISGFLKRHVVSRFTGMGTSDIPVPVNRNRDILTSQLKNKRTAHAILKIESLSKRRFCQHGRQPEVSIVTDGE